MSLKVTCWKIGRSFELHLVASTNEFSFSIYWTCPVYLWRPWNVAENTIKSGVHLLFQTFNCISCPSSINRVLISFCGRSSVVLMWPSTSEVSCLQLNLLMKIIRCGWKSTTKEVDLGVLLCQTPVSKVHLIKFSFRCGIVIQYLTLMCHRSCCFF